MVMFSNAISKVSGLRYIADSLDLQSSLGRQHLLKQHFLVAGKDIDFQLNRVSVFVDLLTAIKGKSKAEGTVGQMDHAMAEKTPCSTDTGNSDKIDQLRHALSEVHDISSTLSFLQSGLTLDDIGLFEVKRFALLVDQISSILRQLNCMAVKLAETVKVIDILDPDKQRIPHFYIYDSYSNTLANLRKQYDCLIKTDLQKAEAVRVESLEVEDGIRLQLSMELKPFAKELMESLTSIADLDVWLAKATLAVKMHYCKPVMGSTVTEYRQLFNPEIADALESRGKTFQPVDIDLMESPCIITGANMAGKTVLLKSVALAQYLFQYGFYIPALKAEIVPVERVITSMADDQSELKGLSSFAAEMLNINAIILASRSHKQILGLIDEPARTTNPHEGLALVNALLDILQKGNVRSLITTHYSGFISDCRRLRVKGLKTDELAVKPTIETINDHMDYSLVEVQSDQVPLEALRIAAILGIDEELIAGASRYLENKRNTNI